MGENNKKVQNKEEERLSTFSRYEIRALKSSIDKVEIQRLRPYLGMDMDMHRDIYKIICNHSNNNRALSLIRLCAPLLYRVRAARNLSLSAETWTREIIAIDYMDGYDDIQRLYFSALELVFMRATAEELRAILAFLVDDTKNLLPFTCADWVYKGPGC